MARKTVSVDVRTEIYLPADTSLEFSAISRSGLVSKPLVKKFAINERADVSLSLIEEKIRAKVVTSLRQEPIPGIEVLFGGERISGVSGDDGVVMMAKVPKDNLSRLAAKVDRLDMILGFDSWELTDEGDLVLCVSDSIQSMGRSDIRIVDRFDRPISKAIVGWRGSVGLGGHECSRSNDNGIATGVFLPDEKWNRAVVYAGGYAAATLTYHLGIEDVELDECLGHQVKVVDSLGKEASWAFVRLTKVEDGKDFEILFIADERGIARAFVDKGWMVSARGHWGGRLSEPVAMSSIVPETIVTVLSPNVELVSGTIRRTSGEIYTGPVQFLIRGSTGAESVMQSSGATFSAQGPWGASVSVRCESHDGYSGVYEGPPRAKRSRQAQRRNCRTNFALTFSETSKVSYCLIRASVY